MKGQGASAGQAGTETAGRGRQRTQYSPFVHLAGAGDASLKKLWRQAFTWRTDAAKLLPSNVGGAVGAVWYGCTCSACRAVRAVNCPVQQPNNNIWLAVLCCTPPATLPKHTFCKQLLDMFPCWSHMRASFCPPCADTQAPRRRPTISNIAPVLIPRSIVAPHLAAKGSRHILQVEGGGYQARKGCGSADCGGGGGSGGSGRNRSGFEAHRQFQ